MEMIQIIENETTLVIETAPNAIEVNRGGPQGVPGPQGPSVSDGDKGDIVVAAGGTTLTIDPALLSAYMRTILPAASEAALKAAINLEIGVDVQAFSAVLAATTASFLTAHATKLGHISVTQAVDLDAIETRVNALDAAVVLKGAWDASAGTFPGSGTAQAGDSYIVSVAGTVGGVAFALNDRIIAIVDNASTTTFAANWFKADYTDQVLSVAGKTGAVTLVVTDVTGAGDVSGPASSVASRVAIFSGTSGKALADSGKLIQTSAIDATVGSLMGVGAFGVGATVQLSAPDLSIVRPSGLYYCSSPTNGPAGNPNGWLEVFDLDANNAFHIFTPVDVGAGMWFNRRASGSWGGWRALGVEGTYTPTGTAVANVDSITPQVCYWSRTGSIVTVWGGVALDFTAGGGATSDARLSLPVASNFGASTDAAGSGANASANSAPLFVNADVTNDALFIRTFAPNTTSNSYAFMASYRVI